MSDRQAPGHSHGSQHSRDELEMLDALSGLRTENDDERASAMQYLESIFDMWIDAVKQKKAGADTAVNTACEPHLSTLLRLKYTAPFPDIRDAAAKVLERVRRADVASVPEPLHKGVSFFIDEAQIVDIDSPEHREGFLIAFLRDGRVSNLTRIMSFHPTYFNAFAQTHSFLMWERGPLPQDWRHMIAILASARHQCDYLVWVNQQLFLECGGSPDWLKGREFLPPKLRQLLILNSLMAHQPWLISHTHIAALTKQHNWSMPELLHAITLLAHYHSLTGIVWGSGCNPELDQINTTRCIPCGASGSFQYPNTSSSSAATATTTAANTASSSSSSTPATTASPLPSGNASVATSSSVPAAAQVVSASSSSVLAAGGVGVGVGGTTASAQSATAPSALSSSSTTSSSVTAAGAGGAGAAATSVTAASSALPATGTASASSSSTTTAAGGGAASSSASTSATTSTAAGSVAATPTKASKEPSDARDIIAKLKKKATLVEEVSAEDNAKAANELASEDIVLIDNVRGSALFGAEGLPDCPPNLRDVHVDSVFGKDRVLRQQKFSWTDHGYSTLNRYYPDVANLIDDEFSTILSLTYDFMGDEAGVDTSKFRMGVWNYVMRIKGIVNDEFQYNDVNQFVTRPVKNFCKILTCYPQTMTRTQFKTFIDIQPSEKVHIILLAVEASKQAELLFALNAVMEFVHQKEL